MVLSIASALTAAALFAVTTNLQREVAASVPSQGSGPVHLLCRLITDRRWLVGGLIGVVALGLHAVALARGSVMVVQSVMALGLVIALYLEAVRERRRLDPNELVGAALVVVGVVTVVGVSRLGDRSVVTGGGVMAVCAAVVLGAFVAVLRSRHAVCSRWGARLLTAAGGACFAVDAVFLQRVAALIDAQTATGVGPGFDGPTVAADVAGFLGASLIGGVAVHRAYQVAPLRSVQPTLAAAEPVTAFGIGVTVLHEGVRAGAFGYLIMVGGLVAIIAGIFVGLVSRRVGRSMAGIMPVEGTLNRQVALVPASLRSRFSQLKRPSTSHRPKLGANLALASAGPRHSLHLPMPSGPSRTGEPPT